LSPSCRFFLKRSRVLPCCAQGRVRINAATKSLRGEALHLAGILLDTVSTCGDFDWPRSAVSGQGYVRSRGPEVIDLLDPLAFPSNRSAQKGTARLPTVRRARSSIGTAFGGASHRGRKILYAGSEYGRQGGALAVSGGGKGSAKFEQCGEYFFPPVDRFQYRVLSRAICAPWICRFAWKFEPFPPDRASLAVSGGERRALWCSAGSTNVRGGGCTGGLGHNGRLYAEAGCDTPTASS